MRERRKRRERGGKEKREKKKKKGERKDNSRWDEGESQSREKRDNEIVFYSLQGV